MAYSLATDQISVIRPHGLAHADGVMRTLEIVTRRELVKFGR